MSEKEGREGRGKVGLLFPGSGGRGRAGVQGRDGRCDGVAGRGRWAGPGTGATDGRAYPGTSPRADPGGLRLSGRVGGFSSFFSMDAVLFGGMWMNRY